MIEKVNLMKCVLVANTDTGSILTATVYFDDGKVTAQPATAADATFVKNLLDTAHAGPGKRIVLANDPKAWFESLPKKYHGTYLVAGIVKDNAAKKKLNCDLIRQG
jgi:hypothetical protein